MISSLRSILPPQIALAERDTLVGPATLLEAERSFVAGSVANRQAEFATGRERARHALDALGVPDAASTAIPVGTHRQPIWPAGIVGSITHCEGHVAAAVARSSTIAALGIDVELHQPLPAEVVAATSYPDEIQAMATADGALWPTVLFSARESIFKAWYPRVGRWLGHHDVRLSIDRLSGALEFDFVGESAALAEEFQLTALKGAVSWNERFVVSTVWLPPST